MSSRRFLTSVAAAAAPQLTVSKIAAASPSVQQQLQTRTLSSNGMVAIDRLRDALESYRQKHYTREMPSRFKKDIIRAATFHHDATASVAREGLQQVIFNIGAQHRVSREDVDTIFSEIGGHEGYIPAEKMLQML